MNVFDVGNRKQLFIDERWFDSQRGMKICVNPPVKCDRVIVPETPWEAGRISAFSTVMEEKGRYRLWYDAIAPRTPELNHPCVNRFLCYAESDDGLNWQRKNVNKFTWNGTSENNIVIPASEGSIMRDPKGSAEHRYKGMLRVWKTDIWPETANVVCPHWEGDKFIGTSELNLCTSPDGINWKIIGPVSDYFHDTHNQMIYDRRLDKYVVYVRTHMNGRTVGRLEIDDPMEIPYIPLENELAKKGRHFNIHSQDRFFTALCRDDNDPPDTDLYTPTVHQYEWADDAYFSFTTPYRHYPVGDTSNTVAQGKDERGRFKNDGPVDIQLAVSRDGIYFDRPDRKPYVSLGLDGAWDAGQVYMAIGMIKKENEIWMYYGGSTHTHGAYDQYSTSKTGGLARLVQRLDGFVSADASYDGANFTTPLITFAGSYLKLNVDCSAMGQVWVEIRDEKNQPIPGYTMAESIDVDRNHIAAPVRWQERNDVSELIDRPVRLYVRARACKLYAFQFCDEE